MTWWLDSLGRGKFSCLVVGSLSFSVKNHSSCPNASQRSFARLSLRLRCLGELFARVFWLCLLLCQEEYVFSLSQEISISF